MKEKETVTLGHGSGGRKTFELIKELLLKNFNNSYLSSLDDSAYLKDDDFLFTSDSFTVKPIFFPGGDIGKLAVCGIVNDLAVCAGRPLFLSLNLIVEEGLPFEELRKIIFSIAKYTRKARLKVVCGDFKVVEKGSADKIFISASGLGRRIKPAHPDFKRIKPKDKIILNGALAEHGIAVMLAREKIFDFTIKSDCDFLSDLLEPLWKNFKGIKFSRDPTRGGLVSCLNEISESSGLGITIDEEEVPLKDEVSSACELLGLDPFYIANEGKAVLIVDKKEAGKVLAAMQKHPKGKNARIIGEVTAQKGKVLLKTISGGSRIMSMLSDFPLPRIC